MGNPTSGSAVGWQNLLNADARSVRANRLRAGIFFDNAIPPGAPQRGGARRKKRGNDMKALHIAKAIATILPMMTAPAFAGAFSQPTGLAVDSSGSLYVANQLSSKVLVFDKNFAAQPQLTITAGLNQPISLAIDPAPVFAQKGTLYVGNIGGAARITTYTLGGTQFTGTTYPAFRPYALAIGGDHVLYDFDNAATLNMYNTTFGTAILQSYPSANTEHTCSVSPRSGRITAFSTSETVKPSSNTPKRCFMPIIQQPVFFRSFHRGQSQAPHSP